MRQILLLLAGMTSFWPMPVGPPVEPVAPSRPPTPYVEVGDFDDEGLGAARASLAGHLAALPETGPRVLTFRVNSWGGSVYDGLDFVREVNDLRHLGIRTVCVVDNRAMSMAFLFLQAACDERLAVPWAILLAHQVRGGAKGGAADLASEALHLAAINRAMALTISRRLGWPIEQYEELVRFGDWTLAADEAIAVGALDGYVTR